MSEVRFRTLVIALAVLNIFVISALAGAVFTLVTKAEPQPSLMPLAGERLPQTERQAFQRALGDARRAARETRIEGQQAKLDVASILGQPTLDQTALTAALAKARQDDFAMREKIETKAVEFVATLPLDDRRLLAQGLLARIAPKPPATK
jgi:uncharacterized membrane protein